MRIVGTLTEDEVDQIILKYLDDEFNIKTVGSRFNAPKHYVELKWTRGPIEFTILVGNVNLTTKYHSRR